MEKTGCEISVVPELALSETRLAGGQEQKRTFPVAILLLESLLWLTCPLFGDFPWDRLSLSIKNRIVSDKGLMLLGRLCLKRIIFFFFHFSLPFFFFLS